MKSVLISGSYFPPQLGGISRFMGEIVAGLGPDEVCCLTGVLAESGPGKKTPLDGIYRRPAAFSKNAWKQVWGGGLALLEILLRERPNVIQLATAYEGYWGLHLQRFLRLPFIVYAHGNEVLDAIKSGWDRPRRSLQRAARVIAVSHYTQKLVLEAGVEPHRVEIVHPGCDVLSFRPSPPDPELAARFRVDPDGPTILSVGGLTPRKGQDVVIRAFPKVRAAVPNLKYLLVGEGPYRVELEEMAQQLGVAEHIVFAGGVPDELMPSIYALSTVLAMPSRERLAMSDVEGFGLVYLEANACGRPVLGGRSGGISDAVVDGQTGLLVDPENTDEVAAALCALLTNPELASRLGEHGRARVLSKFTWPQVVSRIRFILAEVASEGSWRADGKSGSKSKSEIASKKL